MKTMARATKNYGVFCHKNGYVKRFYCLLSCVITKIINFAMCCPSCAPTKTLNLIQTAAWSRTSVFYHHAHKLITRKNKTFRMFGQQVLTKLLSWKESPNFPLQDPNFGFFISLLVMKIFCFENKSHEGKVFK